MSAHLKLRPGPPYSRNNPSMSLVFSDSTRRAQRAHIGYTSKQVENLELEHFETLTKSDTFFRRCLFSRVAIEQLSRAQTKVKTSSYCMVKNSSPIRSTLFPQ